MVLKCSLYYGENSIRFNNELEIDNEDELKKANTLTDCDFSKSYLTLITDRDTF